MARAEIHIQLIVNYSEDPELRKVARYGKDARGLRDLYVQMICYCKRNLTDGHVPDEELGVLVYPDSARIGMRDAERLVDIEVIERTASGFYLPGFLKRNKSKAQVEAESIERAKAGEIGGKRSGMVRRGEAKPKQSASETGSKTEAPKQISLNPESENIGHRSESVTEAETTELTKPSVSPRATRLQTDWRPDAKDIDWARTENIPDDLARRETTKFINYWLAKSGKDATKLDWSRTWQNWLMRAVEQGGIGSNGRPPPNPPANRATTKAQGWLSLPTPDDPPDDPPALEGATA